MARKPANLEAGEIRETVLAVALHLFAVRGYFNTTVPDIARAAQVSVGSIYHYFKDKEDVARSLYTGLMDGLQGELTAIATAHHSAHGRCHAVMKLLFDLTESNREAMEFMIHAKHREFLPDELPVCSSLPFKTMRSFVEAGMREGDIRELNSLVATSALFGGALRLIAARLDGALDVSLPGLLDATWECGWRSIAT